MIPNELLYFKYVLFNFLLIFEMSMMLFLHKCSGDFWWISWSNLYTPVHLVESVENYALRMRRCFSCSSNMSVTHSANHTDASAKRLNYVQLQATASSPSSTLMHIGCKIYWLDDVNWNINADSWYSVRLHWIAHTPVEPQVLFLMAFSAD